MKEGIQKHCEKKGTHFLLFLKCFFLPFQNQILIFSVIFILLSANALHLDKSEIFLFVRDCLPLYQAIKIWHMTKLKAFADNIFSETRKVKFVMGNGENGGNCTK